MVVGEAQAVAADPDHPQSPARVHIVGDKDLVAELVQLLVAVHVVVPGEAHGHGVAVGRQELLQLVHLLEIEGAWAQVYGVVGEHHHALGRRLLELLEPIPQPGQRAALEVVQIGHLAEDPTDVASTEVQAQEAQPAVVEDQVLEPGVHSFFRVLHERIRLEPPLQLSRQQQELRQVDMFQNLLVTDYMFVKDRLFASLNLNEKEMQLYDTVANLLERNIIKPDLVIYLQADTDTLIKNIAARGREMEQEITWDYIDALNQVYTEYFFRYQETPLVIINTSNIDFVHNENDLKEVINYIRQPISGTKFYNPVSEL